MAESSGTQDIDRLIIQLGDGDEKVRDLAVFKLVLIGSPAVEPLIDVLRGKDWRMKRCAATALGSIGKPTFEPGDARVVEPLIAALNDDDVRMWAIRALGETKDARAVAPLIKQYDTEYSDYRGPISESLARIGLPALEPLIANLKNKKEYIRWGAAIGLGYLGNAQAVESLIETLNDSTTDHNFAYLIVVALGKLNDARAVEPLIVILQGKDKEIKSEVAESLGNIGDKRAVAPLIKTLNDGWENSYTRRKFTLALEKITGETLGNEVADWNKWWKKQK